jgi:hypothetical protein
MEAITIGGKKFLGTDESLPAVQDEFILARLRRCGAMDVLTGNDGVKRSPEQRSEALLSAIMLAGETCFVLAGCLTEEGKKWNRADALANAMMFGEITDPEEKLAMRHGIVQFVIGFFQPGAPSSETSQKSSSPSAKVPPIKSAARRTSGTLPS